MIVLLVCDSLIGLCGALLTLYRLWIVCHAGQKVQTQMENLR